MRYAPERPFPSYAYLPGRDPHPTRSPAGHSFGVEETSAGYYDPEDWTANQDFLFGVDLYNHGFLWEAHEAWEGLWHAAKHDELQADFLQGLIQCAAAALKVPMKQPRGVERLAKLGTEKLERVARANAGSYMGVELFDFIADVRTFADSQPESADARPLLELS